MMIKTRIYTVKGIMKKPGSTIQPMILKSNLIGYGVPIMPYERSAFILGSSAGFVDCRVSDGTTVRPDFWH